MTGFWLRCEPNGCPSLDPMSDLGTEENDGVAELPVNSAPSVTIEDELPLRFDAPTCCTLLFLKVDAGVIVVGSGGIKMRLDCGGATGADG